ncbi:MAG: c-type cytochrome [Chloroflexota bacterium]
MKRSEFIARLLIGAAVLAAITVPLTLWWRTPLVHARMAEDGGWSPEAFKATVAQPLHLRLTSDDVVHGFAVGKLDFPAVDVLPGKVTDITLLFQQPGTYTFYCTRWCGLNHWRMRGTIEVTGDPVIKQPGGERSEPLYASLGLDLDAPRSAPLIPAQKPLAAVAEWQLEAELASFMSVDHYRSHSPYEVWRDLRADPAFAAQDDARLWELTAEIWRSNTTLQALAEGEQLFAQNCAACHGEGGAGDGVFADDLAAAGKASLQSMMGNSRMAMQSPARLTDPKRMLDASPALLQGKILRGGMGTGMPSWGPIFTEKQTWNLVAYLYSFQFDYR